MQQDRNIKGNNEINFSPAFRAPYMSELACLTKSAGRTKKKKIWKIYMQNFCMKLLGVNLEFGIVSIVQLAYLRSEFYVHRTKRL